MVVLICCAGQQRQIERENQEALPQGLAAAQGSICCNRLGLYLLLDGCGVPSIANTDLLPVIPPLPAGALVTIELQYCLIELLHCSRVLGGPYEENAEKRRV